MRLPLALLLPALMAIPLRAQAGAGDLLVSPARVTLDNRNRTAELILSNRGDATDTYRIRLIHMEMTADGGLKEGPAPATGVDSATLVRYAPHEITLEPGQTQVLRVMLRKPADLADGEYRIHMLFQAIPPDLAGGAAKDNGKGVSIKLVPILGLAIPVIVRQGDLAAKAGLADLRLEPGKDKAFATFHLTRAGNASVYGNLEAVFQPKGGKAASVALMNGVAVYPPLDARNIRMQLEPPPGVSLKGGTLTVTFQTADEAVPEAEARLEIP
ncbi:MAG TPA: hypothetical protein VL181_09680 [Holophagaceae bacterium]|nr:hypothetical protein [Holophagaceae bacterium]